MMPKEIKIENGDDYLPIDPALLKDKDEIKEDDEMEQFNNWANIWNLFLK